MRETRDCFWMPYSGSGDPLAWMLTAMPLKQGMVGDLSGAAEVEVDGKEG